MKIDRQKWNCESASQACKRKEREQRELVVVVEYSHAQSDVVCVSGDLIRLVHPFSSIN